MMLSRRSFLAGTAAMLATPSWRSPFAARPVPSPSQQLWQQDELAMFVHFGMNTFTDREWGEGTEEPSLFNPSALDAGQWTRTAREAGCRAMILTAKHHDGFCLWPTATTAHSVAASPWRGGDGDVVREFTDACRAEGLRAGLYLSPWDRNAPAYGDSPRYDEMYCAQLTELLTRYGPIHEVWFDGANGEGPNGKRQRYDWPRYWALVRRLQPDAVIFSDAGPDIRWIGNERGVAGATNWSTVDPAVVPFPGATGDRVMAMLQEGDPNGTVWRPGETDVSIRPGWFHHPAEDDRVRTADALVDLYFTSVGRNSKLLLNVPPTRDGLLHATDVARLRAMRSRLDAMFARDRYPAVAGGRPVTISVADLREDIARGQMVSRYALEGFDGTAWRELARGTTIGYCRLERFPAATVSGVRVRVLESMGRAGPIAVALYD
ncbi:MAG TPA: alpha-L-fucosidase [Gemmatimonadaceae bacterium]|nr:alpha-L-fucosidase [Gemmatimonadaceae bacterium]